MQNRGNSRDSDVDGQDGNDNRDFDDGNIENGVDDDGGRDGDVDGDSDCRDEVLVTTAVMVLTMAVTILVGIYPTPALQISNPVPWFPSFPSDKSQKG